MFWLWQQKHSQTAKLLIEPEYTHYPGTSNFDGGQGPTPGRPAGDWLDLGTPLEPFVKADGRTPLISEDIVDIEHQLGFTYGPGSFTDAHGRLSSQFGAVPAAPTPPKHILAVSGINRGAIAGSFTVSTWATVKGEKRLLDLQSVLSRWHTAGCANCQTHLGVKHFVPLHGVEDASDVEVLVHTHDDLGGKEERKGLKAVPISRS